MLNAVGIDMVGIISGRFEKLVAAVLLSVLGTRNNLAVKVRYRLGSRNC